MLPSIYGCENSDIPGTRPVLHKETTPREGTPVQPGDEIVVEITWRVTDWVAPDLHKALDCVYINSRYVPELSGGERPTPNDGHFAYHYVVPADVATGSTICDQGFVSGPNGEEEYGREISNLVCFPVGPPPVPPPPPPPIETTTTTTAEQPLAQHSERFDQEVPPAAAPGPTVRPRDVQPREVLPRTGGDANPARLAAGALGLALLGRSGSRRRTRSRPRS
jgi:LPXTG-motif cell wall-anchored protein